jgi:NADH:ubiquinone reductase (non-electrogenic)
LAPRQQPADARHCATRCRPLLPGAATGAVEDRSIVEPIRTPIAAKVRVCPRACVCARARLRARRRVCAHRLNAHTRSRDAPAAPAAQGFRFFEAAALRVDPAARSVLCRAADLECENERTMGATCDLHTFTVPYDYLVLAVGSVPNTFGIPGVVEHACFFKEIQDAVRFRREASERFERASLPDITPERARELLTFVFVGAGPTGVELAAELHDMVQQDIARLYPASLLEHVSIEIVDLQDFVLSTYDRRIAEYATAQFKRQNIKLHLGVQVKAVEANTLVLADKKTGETRRIDFGICVWCTGIKMNPLCEKLISDLPEGSQPNIRSLTTDSSLRVKVWRALLPR